VGEANGDVEALLSYLKESRGFDFTGYKRTSLTRRIDRRLVQVGIESYSDYLDYLQVHPEEFTELFNTILINVTGFFRDTEVWEYLHTDVIPDLVRAKGSGPIRVWSAGCSSGEEAYTLAMLFAEVLGVDQFRERVKIYATDVDEEALTHARLANYSAQDVRAVPAELLAKYFESAGGRYVFRPELRRSVIFGRNDLVQDAPISRIDLLVCRNTLMYFNAEAQSRILSRFHFALAPDGVLFLGKAEMLLSHAKLFQPNDLKRRVFHKAPGDTTTNAPFLPTGTAETPPPGPAGLDLLRGAALQASPVAQIVVNAEGFIAIVNRQATELFGLTARDVGRPFAELEVSYRPADLRRQVEQAQVDRRATSLPEIEFGRPGGPTVYLEAQVIPLVDPDSRLLGVAMSFHDVTRARQLRGELEQANRQLETAYEELQSTNEELETTNEELQSTVEELETTNEELQSTNEELETMNEELQSINDELQFTNEQLRERSADLDESNEFLEAVLTSLRAGVAVLDRNLVVRAWNRHAEDMWGLRAEEAQGQHFLNLDIGLPTQQLRPMIRQALGGDQGPHGIQLAAINRKGRGIRVRVVCSALQTRNSEDTGAILVMEEEPGKDGQPEAPPAAAE
jgi:two-component system CheB/CheR fusion protein